MVHAKTKRPKGVETQFIASLSVISVTSVAKEKLSVLSALCENNIQHPLVRARMCAHLQVKWRKSRHNGKGRIMEVVSNQQDREIVKSETCLPECIWSASVDGVSVISVISVAIKQ